MSGCRIRNERAIRRRSTPGTGRIQVGEKEALLQVLQSAATP